MDILLATILTCEEAKGIIFKMQTYRTSEEHRSEMIQIVKDSVRECDWDAKAD